MNLNNFNLTVSTCLRFDHVFRQKLIHSCVNLYKNSVSGRRCFEARCVRYVQTGMPSFQAERDGITVLPSPQEVTSMLRKNEFQKEFTTGSVKSYDSNQLASNQPIEDTRSEGQCKLISGFLCGVFDGHAGPSCAQVISTRLLNYIAAALLPNDTLLKYIKEGSKESLVETYNDRVVLVDELKIQYEKSFIDYLHTLADNLQGTADVKASLESAVLKLDSDLSKEVLNSFKEKGEVNRNNLMVALTGAVVCVCYVDGPHLYVANTGDCAAVVGSMVEEDEWVAKKITKEHDSDNYDELRRIWSEHPPNEKKTVIKRHRLLGNLAPLRSMGDYQFKWPVETLKDVAVPILGPTVIPAHYHTPPYLTARPDVYHHRLTPKDKFLLIASDGLWEMLTPEQAVKLVGEHMKGKLFFNPLTLPKTDNQLGDINELLMHRRESLKRKPKDSNAATHLIRHALGGTEYGVDHAKLAKLLSLSPEVSRSFRDDITVTILYFDTDFLTQCPA